MSSPTIRPARQADAVAVSAIYAPFVDRSAISFEVVVPAPAEIARRMAAAPRLPWLVAEQDAEVIGYAYAARHRERAAYRWSADVSVYLGCGHRGRGVGRALYERLIREMRALGYVSLFAGITVPNEASTRVHRAVGFAPLGVYPNVGFKLGRWHSVSWWVLPLLDEPPDQPGEPREWLAS